MVNESKTKMTIKFFKFNGHFCIFPVYNKANKTFISAIKHALRAA